MGPRRGRGSGLAPRHTRSGPRDGVVPGGSLRRRSWAACAAVVGVCGPGHKLNTQNHGSHSTPEGFSRWPFENCGRVGHRYEYCKQAADWPKILRCFQIRSEKRQQTMQNAMNLQQALTQHGKSMDMMPYCFKKSSVRATVADHRRPRHREVDRDHRPHSYDHQTTSRTTQPWRRFPRKFGALCGLQSHRKYCRISWRHGFEL